MLCSKRRADVRKLIPTTTRWFARPVHCPLMGQLASKAGKFVWGELEVRIIMVGLDASGKTTILCASLLVNVPCLSRLMTAVVPDTS